MELPEGLKDAIAAELDRVGLHRVTEAAEELSQRYRHQAPFEGKSPKPARFMTSAAHRAAYLGTRMPATFAAVSHVMRELQVRMPEQPFHTLLDLGAGPGTVMWAVAEVFPSLQKVMLVEQDAELTVIGQRLAKQALCSAVRSAAWQIADLRNVEHNEKFDLVTLSYALGEIPEESMPAIVKRCWQMANTAVVIIEPGTMAGFACIRTARQELIALGAHMVAPCPHADRCPMPENDWCHFAARLARSSEHRQAKGGVLSYEDEKFSYVVVAKPMVSMCSGRVLRHPLKRSGHVCLSLCTGEGLKQETISKKRGEVYKQARKVEWGDGMCVMDGVMDGGMRDDYRNE